MSTEAFTPPTPGTRATADLPHSCGGCSNRWSGEGTAHCPSCHRTFTGLEAFDAHRVNGRCLNPSRSRKPRFELADGRAYEAWRVAR